jgi:hypothetical protein
MTAMWMWCLLPPPLASLESQRGLEMQQALAGMAWGKRMTMTRT